MYKTKLEASNFFNLQNSHTAYFTTIIFLYTSKLINLLTFLRFELSIRQSLPLLCDLYPALVLLPQLCHPSGPGHHARYCAATDPVLSIALHLPLAFLSHDADSSGLLLNYEIGRIALAPRGDGDAELKKDKEGVLRGY